MIKPAINLTREEYFSFKEEGLTDKQIVSRINEKIHRLAAWKKENITEKESRRTMIKRQHGKSTFKPPVQSMNKVHEWKMTEEERLAYIEKHPIRPTKRTKQQPFADIGGYGERRKKRVD
ncbi:hypothetical protein [Domibacillus aminovorans]|uniref:Uncharacterized protein n=1 Tax=Domibacillus aminovorans TaxID=29332 RepID=A0A177L4Y3_9BACI|nr:hypothetical protein [Domibacillus aminovorans]OAH60739.1 hypothetical protein AWH49_15475 [Domibacillus aminovorans]